MRFKKGEKSGGRGSSFKHALLYYLHDKRPEGSNEAHPDTAGRTGFVHLNNLATDNPDEAWREMATLCNVANILQRENAEREGKRYRRRADLEQPVYAYSLNFHEDDFKGWTDEDRRAAMLEQAQASIRALGMEDHQAVIVEHLPEPRPEGGFTSPHVHVCLNLIHPETGIANKLFMDEVKLSDLCAEYEISRGVIRSPTEHEKYMAKLAKTNKRRHAEIQKMTLTHAEPVTTGHQTRDEWKARKGRDNSKAASAEAAAIKKRFNDEYRQRRQREDAARERRRAEMNLAWKNYQTAKRELWQNYQPQINEVWKRPRRGDLSALQRVRAFLHDPAQTLRDQRDRREWKALGRRQWQERRAFQMRERTITGAIGNAIRLSRVGGATVYRGRLAGVFHLTRDAAERRRLFEVQQEASKKALRDRQNARKKLLADPIKAKRDAEISAMAEAYQRKRDEIEARHTREGAAEKAARAASNLQRAAAWSAWREKFNITDRPGYTAPGQQTEKPTTRPIFARAASGQQEQDPERTGGKAFSAFKEAAKGITEPQQPQERSGGRERARPAPGKNSGPKSD
ncbi:relaxase/mobilization nuclease domain-containing protein [Microvirga sesbaniae]|uniref:relaxase/mobilization nuclease domain-containing protein n=1 Tax=Microvirga sesbaniae TaxID=681392 RepID=UPI0021C6AECE|nr:relaxase/mobilization nuclease domain-containing protein [Microvirga sp. HBU67692]